MKKIVAIIAVIALVAVLGVVLFACVPSSADKAKTKLEKADYTVEVEKIDADMAKLMKADGAKESLYAESKDGKDMVAAIYFDSAKNAKAFYNDNKATYEKMDNIKVGRSGKCVYYGTEAGVKALKK